MPLNPETHCLDCGEPLSEYGHCWQHHYPPMDPAQDKAQPAPYCNGQCGICSCIPSPQPPPATKPNPIATALALCVLMGSLYFTLYLAAR
jgi:hypothetical protein